MGWHHILTFETTFSEPDKSNNPWKGKNPRKPTHVSVAMPPDNWLCQKLERLNLTALEGYPSRLQDSAGLKKDQFIKVPKSQSKWYSMHLVKPDGPHRPGRTVFSWRNTEAKANSQFPRLTKASAYPSTGPPSRPISQESLRRWERAAREDSYIINHAAGFSRCSTELQEKMSQNVVLSVRLSKAKAQKEISDALNDLRDLLAFHQRVSIALGTSLQHLADKLFVQYDFPETGFLGGDHIGTNPMTVGTEDLQLPLSKPHRLNNSHGVNLVDTVPEDVGVAEVPTLVFPRPSHTNSLNDNYCVKPNSLHVNLVRREAVFYQTQCLNKQKVNLDVSCPVVFHAPSVHFPGPGERPVPCQNKIKYVKDVCCVQLILKPRERKRNETSVVPPKAYF